MSLRVLVVAAHADDEALGCGGSLIRHAREGAEIRALFLTNGVGSRESAGSREATLRREAMDNALHILGVSHHKRLNYPDNATDSVPLLDVVKSIEQFSDEWGTPHIVYTHHPGDLNVDHQIANRAALTCFRPQPQTAGKPAKILTFEVLSSTGWSGKPGTDSFMPNYFVDITSILARKLKALRAYADEMRPWPHARSLEAVEHLARFRGATVGVAAAEAFDVARIVDLEE